MTLELAATIQTKPIDYSDIPMAYWPSRTKVKFPDGRLTLGPVREKISAVCRSIADCNDLVAFFGGRSNFCPDLPVLLLIPGYQPELVVGLGYATAAELRDCCCEVWGVKTGGDAYKRFNNDELREMHGLARKEDVDALTREAFWERIKRHKASPITDPWKQWEYPNPTQKVVFAEQPAQEWKGETDD